MEKNIYTQKNSSNFVKFFPDLWDGKQKKTKLTGTNNKYEKSLEVLNKPELTHLAGRLKILKILQIKALSGMDHFAYAFHKHQRSGHCGARG